MTKADRTEHCTIVYVDASTALQPGWAAGCVDHDWVSPRTRRTPTKALQDALAHEADEHGLDAAVRVAKTRAGLDPDALHSPASFVDHLDEEWRRPFWERQLDRVIELSVSSGVES